MGFSILSRRGRVAVTTALALAGFGAAAGVAACNGLWLTAVGAGLVVVALTVGALFAATRVPIAQPASAGRVERDALVDRLLLDASPTPLLLVEGGAVRALNRAARTMFATADRILPDPPAIRDRDATHLRHAGHGWRMDRVQVGAGEVVALIDVEGEERTAEARASAEMIRVLGHEMLNGLVPIVSLAECGVAAADPATGDPALLPEILNTLARRAEGLQRFTEAYRALARLPPPLRQPVAVADLVEDLARLFASRWPGNRLTVDVASGLVASLDRDQLNQALWALLQNAVEAAAPDRAAQVALHARMDGGALVIDVVDDGPGIPPDQATAIFRPFHTTKATGTGIGLSLARQIAQAHGGTLTLVPGSQTVFHCRIPAGPRPGDGV